MVRFGSGFGLDLLGASTLSSDLFTFHGLGAQGGSQVAVVYEVGAFKADMFLKLSDRGSVD